MKLCALTLALIIQGVLGTVTREPSSGMLTVRVGEELKFKARNTDGAVLCTIQVPNGDDGHGSIGFDPLNDAQESFLGRTDEGWTAGWYGTDEKDCGIRIPKLVEKDSGNWSINVGPTGASQVEVDFLVTIQVAPPEVKFDPDEETKQFEVEANQDTATPENITCIARDVRPEPDVEFFVGDERVYNESLLVRELIPYDQGSTNPNSPDFPDMFSVVDKFLFAAKPSDDNKLIKCVYSHPAFTQEELNQGMNQAVLNISVIGPPAKEDFRVEGASSQIGEPAEIRLTFQSNPEPTKVVWFMHDLDMPLGANVTMNTRAANVDFNTSSSGRYSVGELTRSGNAYTTRMAISEIEESDEGQINTIIVENSKGQTNYTIRFENLESGGLDTLAIVGIIVGVVAGVAIIGGAAFAVKKNKDKKKKKQKAAAAAHNAGAPRHDSAIMVEIPVREAGIDNPNAEEITQYENQQEVQQNEQQI